VHPSRPIVHSRVLLGLHAEPVSVECHIGGGLPSTTIVGLAAGVVRESRDRVRSALANCGFSYPDGNVVINLAPGHLVKNQAGLDLPIALAILAASAQIKTDRLKLLEFVGELGLFGELRRVNGAIAYANAASQSSRHMVLPGQNGTEAGLLAAGQAHLANNLLEISAYLNGHTPCLGEAERSLPKSEPTPRRGFEQIVGQQAAQRALVVAAAGAHHLLMVGPPGAGKTAMARSFADLLSPLEDTARLEVAAIYSAAGYTRENYETPPFRDPHHSASAVAIVGGGNPPMPGEIALAHHGVLFLDELPHFKPAVLNLLREPIETGQAVITRANYRVSYPCRFQLLAAMNPCPAGRHCTEDACRCNPADVMRYQARLAGPILDRIDIQIEVPALEPHHIERLRQISDPSAPTSDGPAEVARARAIQLERHGCSNANLDQEQLRQHMRNGQVSDDFLRHAMARYQISARGYLKLWRLARTIADLADESQIQQAHMAEAMGYRALDWESGI